MIIVYAALRVINCFRNCIANVVRLDPVVYSVQEGSSSVFVTINGTTTFPVLEQVQVRLQSIGRDGDSFATGTN